MCLWLTSAEQYFWDVVRRAEICDVYPGPEPGSEYVRLYVLDDQPDGPMDLAVRRRDGRPWARPEPGARSDVMVWVVKDAHRAWTSNGFVPPSPRPDAWCLVCATEADARAVVGGRPPGPDAGPITGRNDAG